MQEEQTPSNLNVNPNEKSHDQCGEIEKKPLKRKTLLMTNGKTGFELANWEEALEEKKKQSNRYYKGEEVSPFVNIQHFKMYGPGIYLFFSSIWDLAILFLILSILELMTMIYNYIEGTTLMYSGQSLSVVATRMTLGAHEYTSATTYDLSIQHKLFNVIPDIVSCCVFLAFYFYQVSKSTRINKEIRKQVLFPSYYTVEVTEFPKTANPMMIEDFMSRFGSIKEVAPIKNYSQKINLCKKIFQIQTQIKEIEIQVENDQSYKEKGQKKMAQKQQKIQQLVSQFQKLQQEYGSKYLKFFVSYETIDERDEVLKLFSKYQKSCQCCRDPPPENMMLNGERVYIQKCDVQPGGILWENVHIGWNTRWLRFLLQSLLLLTLLIGGFLFISYLNVAYAGETYPNIDTSGYTSTTILSETNTTIITSWCIKNTDFNVQSVYDLCMNDWSIYYASIGITFAISISIVLFKVILKFIMIGIAKFQRYTNHTELSKNIMKNLMITYISTTVLIIFLMQANVFNISFKSFLSLITSDATILSNLDSLTQYSDLTAPWYLDIGYQIWFNWLILAVQDLAMPVVHCLMECLNECFGKRQVLHKNMVKKIQPEQFQIEDHYAHVMMIVFIGFTFSGGMPSILILSFIGLMFRYVYYKYAFIRYSRVPPAYNEALNDELIRLLPITLIAHCFLSIYMYGTDIFAAESSFLTTYLTTYDLAVVSELATLLYRIVDTWYLTAMTVIFIIVIVLKSLLIDFILSLKEDKDDLNKTIGAGNDELQARSQRTLTKSYKLEKNPDYFEIIAILKMVEKKEKKNQRQSIKVVQNDTIL